MTRQRPLTTVLASLGALVALVILLFPLYAVIIGSFENNNQLLGTHYNFLPPTPSWANYSAGIHTQGGPANSTQLLATWGYNLTFQQFEYGQGAALNTVLLLIALVAAPIYIRLNRDSLRRA